MDRALLPHDYLVHPEPSGGHTLVLKTSESDFFILENTTLLPMIDLPTDSNLQARLGDRSTPVANKEANLSVLPHQIVLVESLATNVNDLLPRYLRKRHARELVVLAVCGLCLLVWLLIITKVNRKEAYSCRTFNLRMLVSGPKSC